MEKPRSIQGTDGLPIYELQLCYTYAGNLKFIGVLMFDVTINDWVIKNLHSDIRFQISLLDEIHVCTGIDLCSMSELDTQQYLAFRGLSMR